MNTYSNLTTQWRKFIREKEEGEQRLRHLVVFSESNQILFRELQFVDVGRMSKLRIIGHDISHAYLEFEANGINYMFEFSYQTKINYRMKLSDLTYQTTKDNQLILTSVQNKNMLFNEKELDTLLDYFREFHILSYLKLIK